MIAFALYGCKFFCDRTLVDGVAVVDGKLPLLAKQLLQGFKIEGETPERRPYINVRLSPDSFADVGSSSPIAVFFETEEK